MAGQALGAAGKRVIILEARSRIGGRIHTDQPLGFTNKVELGAEFVHGDLPLTMDIIRAAKLSTYTMAGQPWNIQKGKIEKSSMLDFDWETLMNKANALKEDITLDQFIHQHLQDPKHQSLVASLTRFVEGYDAADPKLISMFALRDEWSQEEEPSQYRIEGGYLQVIDWLKMKCESSGIELMLNQKVQLVRWDQAGVEVRTSNDHFYSSRLIVTIPVGILISRSIQFVPDIPDQVAAAKKIGVGGVIKFVAEFKSAFWEDESNRHFLPKAGFIFSDAPIPTWWTQQPDERPLLTGWLSGPKAFGKNDPEQQRIEATESLCYILGCTEEFLSENLRGLEVVDWINDPYARGAYSYATPETVDAKKVLNTPLANKIYFAGEALYEGREMGTVEAALSSGKYVADKLLNSQ
jgi:monoamine oxidase